MDTSLAIFNINMPERLGEGVDGIADVDSSDRQGMQAWHVGSMELRAKQDNEDDGSDQTDEGSQGDAFEVEGEVFLFELFEFHF